MVDTVLDTQNEIKEIANTFSGESTVAIKFEGDFDSGNIEIGYTDDGTASGSLFPATTASADGDTIYTIGRGQIVFARATGASPAINVKTSIVS